jgi:toxin HigB-1
MIKSYRDRKTRQFAKGGRVKAFEGFHRQAEKRLEILEAAPSLESLRSLRSNRLEVLSGARAREFSIRINKQWRICFEWLPGDDGPSNVEITDYH